jgi:hypothetical protein
VTSHTAKQNLNFFYFIQPGIETMASSYYREYQMPVELKVAAARAQTHPKPIALTSPITGFDSPSSSKVPVEQQVLRERRPDIG